jgi:hypothetical protein
MPSRPDMAFTSQEAAASAWNTRANVNLTGDLNSGCTPKLPVDNIVSQRPDIIIKFIRENGKWRVRIGNGAIPQMFNTFNDAVNEVPEYFDNREVG